MSLNFRGEIMEIKKKLLDIVRDTVRFKHYSCQANSKTKLISPLEF